ILPTLNKKHIYKSCSERNKEQVQDLKNGTVAHVDEKSFHSKVAIRNQETYLNNKDTMHFNSFNPKDKPASSKKIIEWSLKPTLVRPFRLFFAEEIIASFFTGFNRHLYQIGIAYQNNTKQFIKQKISKEAHNNTFNVKVSNKSQLPTFTTEYEHRNQISDISKFPKIYSKMNAYRNILRPALTRRIDFGNTFHNVPLNKILLPSTSFDSEDQSNKISVDRKVNVEKVDPIDAPSENIKVQYENLDYNNETDPDEQIYNRILEIQQDIDIARDKIKGEYNDLNIFYSNMHNEVANLLEEIITENTKLNVRLFGPTAYEIGVKEVPYSRKNRIKFPGSCTACCSRNVQTQNTISSTPTAGA
ncbi:13406_t:CDS:2, partial [Cetraspora pellucida]